MKWKTKHEDDTKFRVWARAEVVLKIPCNSVWNLETQMAQVLHQARTDAAQIVETAFHKQQVGVKIEDMNITTVNVGSRTIETKIAWFTGIARVSANHVKTANKENEEKE